LGEVKCEKSKVPFHLKNGARDYELRIMHGVYVG